MHRWCLIAAILAGSVHCTYPKDVDHSVVFVKNGLTPLSSRSSTGYIPVSNSSSVFYWLFYAEEQSAKKPTLVWVQGQIGVSSMLGALREFTPAWTKHFNLLFVDSSVGVGFSPAGLEADYATTSDEVAAQTVFFLKDFFARHTELKNREIILSGEDYAGHTLPVTAHRALSEGDKLPFKVIGMSVGNGHTHAPIQVITKAESAAIFGLVDGPSLIEAREHAWAASVDSVAGDAAASLDERDKLEETILSSAKGVNMANIGQQLSDAEPVMVEIATWMNNTDNLDAIGVPKQYYPVKSPIVFEHLKNDIMTVMWDQITALLDAGVVTLWYQGQLDWVDGVYSNEAWINALQWSGKDQYAKQIHTKWSAGYMRTYGPLREAMVQGAGHLALVDKNKDMLGLFLDTFGDDKRTATLAEQTVHAPLV